MIELNEYESSRKITELNILTYISRLGYIVSVPFGNSDKYDQICDIHGKLLRVQIKTARWKDERKSGIFFNCYSVANGKKHSYTKQDIDFYATSWLDKCYLVPVEDCGLEKNSMVKI